MTVQEVIALAQAGFSANQIQQMATPTPTSTAPTALVAASSVPATYQVPTVQATAPVAAPTAYAAPTQPVTMQDVASYVQSVNRNNITFDMPPARTTDQILGERLDNQLGVPNLQTPAPMSAPIGGYSNGK